MKAPLPVEAIEWAPKMGLRFATTDDLEPIREIVGQRRAMDALHFGLSMHSGGYNMFVMGALGSGRQRLVRLTVGDAARARPTPSDWCYVENFAEPRHPNAISIPAGMGRQLRAAMQAFVTELQTALRTAFAGEDYRTLQQTIEEEFRDKNEEALQGIEEAAQKQGLTLLRTPSGFVFAPVKDGEVMPPEAFQALSPDAAETVKKQIRAMETELQHALQQTPKWAADARDKVRELNQRTGAYALTYPLTNLRQQFSEKGLPDSHELFRHFDNIYKDVLKSLDTIIGALAETKDGVFDRNADLHPVFQRYLVNLFIDNSGLEHAPVIFEDEPSLDRLVGKVEHRAEMGTLQTDFALIRPGALHTANGGYLVVDAQKLLTRPASWEALKRCVFAREVRIESAVEMLGIAQTITLEPETIPLDIKIILIGERDVFYALSAYDSEFNRLFKIVVDLEDDIDATPENTELYVRLVASMARDMNLLPLSQGAVTETLRYAAREADHQGRLTMDVLRVQDLMREASQIAHGRRRAAIEAADVDEAWRQRIDRLARIPERIYQSIDEEIIDIDTAGAVVGQINGLSVSQIGAMRFGRPTRITARTALGRGEFVDIEREVAMGGPSHSKGVLILSSFIRSTFGQSYPISLQASLVFEQSYGGVDGDSASLAELCALLSSIAEAPIRQCFAVTGSINQFGGVQAIGGVNEKIEGFFDICAKRGLDGTHGVILPESNRRHLVLATRVTEAVKQGKFSLYAVSNVSEALEILTGIPSGVGETPFPPGSLFARAARRLADLNEARKSAMLGAWEPNA